MAGGKGGRRQVTRTVPSPAAHVGRQGAEPPAWLARSQAGLSAPQAAAPTTPQSPLLWTPPPRRGPLSPSWLFLVCFPPPSPSGNSRGGDPTLPAMALPTATTHPPNSQHIPVSKVQLSFGLRWNLLKSVQTLPFKLRLHPRPVATGRRAVCCWPPGAGMEPRALGTLPAETLWRRDRRILSHRAWMMLSASRRPGVGCDLF